MRGRGELLSLIFADSSVSRLHSYVLYLQTCTLKVHIFMWDFLFAPAAVVCMTAFAMTDAHDSLLDSLYSVCVA